MTVRWSVFLLLAVSLAALAGCSDFVDHDQPQVDPASQITLESGHTLGQTFVARHGGLNGLRIWLEPGSQNPGEVRLRLWMDPSATQDAVTATLSLSQITTPGFYNFDFPALHDSNGRYLYAELETLGQATLSVRAAPGDTYWDGALYQDRQPQDSQAAFLLTYDPWWMLADLIRAAWAGFGLMMVTLLLFVVPGWALLAWMSPTTDLPWAGKLAIGAGISLALYPILFLWTDLIGLHLGPLYAGLPAIGGLAALALRYRIWKPARFWEGLRAWAHSEALWPDLLLIVVVGLIFSGRLLVVRTLDAPSWGDSYQHTMITQLLVDNRGLFDSWEPYAPYRSLTVHFGFSSFAALLSWFTAMDSVRATLLVGQLINGLAIVTLYPLATRACWRESLGRSGSCVGGRASVPNARLLRELGSVCAVGRSGYSARGCLAALGGGKAGTCFLEVALPCRTCSLGHDVNILPHAAVLCVLCFRLADRVGFDDLAVGRATLVEGNSMPCPNRRGCPVVYRALGRTSGRRESRYRSSCWYYSKDLRCRRSWQTTAFGATLPSTCRCRCCSRP